VVECYEIGMRQNAAAAVIAAAVVATSACSEKDLCSPAVNTQLRARGGGGLEPGTYVIELNRPDLNGTATCTIASAADASACAPSSIGASARIDRTLSPPIQFIEIDNGGTPPEFRVRVTAGAKLLADETLRPSYRKPADGERCEWVNGGPLVVQVDHP